jgi:hypothetical protein
MREEHMENKKKFLKEAFVLMTAVVLFLSVSVTAEIVENDFSEAYVSADTIGEELIKIDIQNNPKIISEKGYTLFLQSPNPSSGNWYAYTSDLNSPYRCFDNFWDITQPICDIHWWGLSLFWNGAGWEDCDPDGMLFDIAFYTESGGEPGDLVCQYSQVSPAYEFYDNYNSWSGYKWSYDLDPCCELDWGWVSIASSSSSNECWFLWMNSPDGDKQCLQVGGDPEWKDDDLAFELTGTQPCEPSIVVEKYVWDEANGEWVDADTEAEAIRLPICQDVYFKIVIHNNGNIDLKDIVVMDKMHDSLRFISANPGPDEYVYDPPFHYMDWYFPGPLPPCNTIEIYITAHVEGPEDSYDFNFVLVEANGCGQTVSDEDYAWVNAYKKSRDANIYIHSLLEHFIQQHPYLVKILNLLIKHLDIF